jgi:hypothetical protein
VQRQGVDREASCGGTTPGKGASRGGRHVLGSATLAASRQPAHVRLLVADEIPAMTSAGVGEWFPCHCCGRSYEARNMVRFDRHPEHGICVGCAEWLYNRSRPIVRRLHPIWQLPARVRARIMPRQLSDSAKDAPQLVLNGSTPRSTGQ